MPAPTSGFAVRFGPLKREGWFLASSLTTDLQRDAHAIIDLSADTIIKSRSTETPAPADRDFLDSLTFQPIASRSL